MSYKTMTVCPKEIKIYHVFGHKVGSTSNLPNRMRSQSIKEGAYEVLAALPANVLTYREVWETEQDYAVMKGFEPENESHWQNFFRQHTNNITKDLAVRAKISEGLSGKTLSDDHKVNISKALTGSKHPNFGKTLSDKTKALLSVLNSGENHPHFGKTGAKHHCAKPANLYRNGTDELVAEGINISEWAKENWSCHGLVPVSFEQCLL